MTMRISIKNEDADTGAYAAVVKQGDKEVATLQPQQSVEVWLHSADYSNVTISETASILAQQVAQEQPPVDNAHVAEGCEKFAETPTTEGEVNNG